MAKKQAKQQDAFYKDWRSLTAKPELGGNKKNFNDGKIEEPYRVKRQGSYASMYPSEEGETYSFAIIPDKDGKSFIMTDVMTIKRFKFKNPKTKEDYFENLKIPMDPSLLFDMGVVDKATEDPSSLTEEDKTVLKNIKRHADLVKRYKDLYWCKTENVGIKYSPASGRYNNRLKKESLTGFFGITTKWKNVANSDAEYSVKFIQTRYSQFQEKFNTLLEQTAKTHDDLQPEWYEDYFSSNGGIKGIINVEMGSMKVGGKGATVKLVKLGKDLIEDRGVGVTGDIDVSKIKFLDGEENALSHLHYYMGFDAREDLWQDMYVDRFEEAVEDLEKHVKEVAANNALESSESTDSKSEGSDDLPF